MSDPNLPEGTDHIINGAGVGPDDGDGRPGAAPDQRIGEETMFTPDEKPTADGSSDGGATAGGRPGEGGTTTNLFETLGNWQTTGTDKAREYAQAGLDRATGALDDVVKMIQDAADQIDDKVGEQYGQYARRAAESLGGFGGNFRGKDVDALFTDAREFVKKSPAVAIGAAAALGFVFARLARAGVDAGSAGEPGGAKGGTKGRGAA